MSVIWLAIIAALLGSLFSALHLSLVDLARAALEEIATVKGNRRKIKQVDAILDDTPGHARAAAVPRIVFDAVLVVSTIVAVMHLRGSTTLTAADAAIGIAIAGAVLWVLGVALPMSIAWHLGERLVYLCSGILRTLYKAMLPIRAVPRLIDRAVKRMAGVQAENGSEVLQAELLSVVEEGEREGQIDEAEREMIEAVVEFRNLFAKQVMTPRTEIQAFEATDDLGAVTRIIKQVGHSRIPVYEGNLDNIIGIFYVKDLMRWLAGAGPMPSSGPSTPDDGTRKPGQPFNLRAILRPALFVPETKPVRELLRELLARKVHIAMIADEFGGTAGLATIEDIMEEIIGDIRDEYELPDDGAAEVEVKPDEHAADVDARAYIDDVNDALTPLGWAIPEGDDYDTVGGFVMTTLGRIPTQGESFRHDRAVVRILEASPTRVLRVRFEVRPPEREDGDRDREQPVEAAAETGDAGDEHQPSPASR